MSDEPSSPKRAPLPLAAWSAQERAHIRGVITDIDDTLTTEGRLAETTREALQALTQAGLSVLAVTGRPVGWSLPHLSGAQAWPMLGIVAENGAVALKATTDGHIQRWYRDSTATRNAHWQRLQSALADIEAQIPGARRSEDSVGRETDIAIDHREHHRLRPQQIEAVVQRLRAHGLRVTVSSIHINAWLGEHNKWIGACWALRNWLQRELADELNQWVYVGDSSNDEVMFEHIPQSVGVANIARFLPGLAHTPRFICQAEGGAGFAELADALLQVRAPASSAPPTAQHEKMRQG